MRDGIFVQKHGQGRRGSDGELLTFWHHTPASIDGHFAQLFFDAEQLVIFREPVRARQ